MNLSPDLIIAILAVAVIGLLVYLGVKSHVATALSSYAGRAATAIRTEDIVLTDATLAAVWSRDLGLLAAAKTRASDAAAEATALEAKIAAAYKALTPPAAS